MEVTVAQRGRPSGMFAPPTRVADAVQLEARSVLHTWRLDVHGSGFAACRRWGVPLVDGSIRLGGYHRDEAVDRSLAGRRRPDSWRQQYAGFALSASDQDPRGRVVYNGFDKRRLSGFALVSERTHQPLSRWRQEWRREKDFDLVLDAAEILGQTDPGRWRFVLIGSGATREDLVSRARGISGV